MVFVCGVLKGDILYVTDNKFYQTSQGAERRCKYLNTTSSYGQGDWTVLYQDRFKVYKEDNNQ